MDLLLNPDCITKKRSVSTLTYSVGREVIMENTCMYYVSRLLTCGHQICIVGVPDTYAPIDRFTSGLTYLFLGVKM